MSRLSAQDLRQRLLHAEEVRERRLDDLLALDDDLFDRYVGSCFRDRSLMEELKSLVAFDLTFCLRVRRAVRIKKQMLQAQFASRKGDPEHDDWRAAATKFMAHLNVLDQDVRELRRNHGEPPDPGHSEERLVENARNDHVNKAKRIAEGRMKNEEKTVLLALALREVCREALSVGVMDYALDDIIHPYIRDSDGLPMTLGQLFDEGKWDIEQNPHGARAFRVSAGDLEHLGAKKREEE